MVGLRRLALHDCNNITNNGMGHLLQLTQLEELSFRGCRKITNSGLELLSVRGPLSVFALRSCVWVCACVVE